MRKCKTLNQFWKSLYTTRMEYVSSIVMIFESLWGARVIMWLLTFTTIYKVCPYSFRIPVLPLVLITTLQVRVVCCSASGHLASCILYVISLIHSALCVCEPLRLLPVPDVLWPLVYIQPLILFLLHNLFFYYLGFYFGWGV
jgi:hypothetical protein